MNSATLALRQILGRHIIGPMDRQRQERRSRPTWIEVAVASVMVVGVSLALVRVSLLNNGAIIAPALAGVLLLGVFGVRTMVPAGRARSLLTLVGGGLLVVGLLFLAALVALLIALSNRGT